MVTGRPVKRKMDFAFSTLMSRLSVCFLVSTSVTLICTFIAHWGRHCERLSRAITWLRWMSSLYKTLLTGYLTYYSSQNLAANTLERKYEFCWVYCSLHICFKCCNNIDFLGRSRSLECLLFEYLDKNLIIATTL